MSEEKKNDTNSNHLSVKDNFDIISTRTIHEANLINQRLNWMLLVQGFLIAAFATIVTKCDCKNEKHLNNIFSLLIFLIPFAGLIIATLTLSGIKAANLAIDQIRRSFRADINKCDKLRFGGKGCSKFLGRWSPYLLCITFIIFWIILLIFKLCLI